MEFRMKQLREAVATNAAGRLSEVQDIVDAIEKDADEMCSAERLFREGKLPKRICHCDTKVSNMLFDEDGKVLCVIDLDTVMPASSSPISVTSFVRQPIQAKKTKRI